jgi:hypothetical protein
MGRWKPKGCEGSISDRTSVMAATAGSPRSFNGDLRIGGYP